MIGDRLMLWAPLHKSGETFARIMSAKRATKIVSVPVVSHDTAPSRTTHTRAHAQAARRHILVSVLAKDIITRNEKKETNVKDEPRGRTMSARQWINK